MFNSAVQTGSAEDAAPEGCRRQRPIPTVPRPIAPGWATVRQIDARVLKTIYKTLAYK